MQDPAVNFRISSNSIERVDSLPSDAFSHSLSRLTRSEKLRQLIALGLDRLEERKHEAVGAFMALVNEASE